MATGIIITIVILGALYYIVILRNGNLSFWKKAAKNPDFVYEQFLQDNAWVIDDGSGKIDESKFFLDQISQQKTNAEQWRGEIETTKSQSAEAHGEIKALKEEIEETKEGLTEKLSAVEIKKEDIDKFFIKIFGVEDAQGKRSGGLSTRISQKEKEADAFLNTQEKKYKELFEKSICLFFFLAYPCTKSA